MKIRTPIFLAIMAILLISCSHSTPHFDEAQWRKDTESRKVADLYAPHFKDGKFFNPWMPFENPGFMRFLRWKLFSRQKYTAEEEAFRPGFVPNLKDRIKAAGDGDFIAWIGHNSFLIRLKGEYWLTDPMFSERALLPKRVTPPAITAEEVNELEGKINVVISHNHYDHLDAASIRALRPDTRLYVPLGLKKFVEDLNKTAVVEMDWWQERDHGNGARLICLPAQHWSRRFTQGIDTTLWASFLLSTESVKIYLGGDSGYFMGYKEFGRKFPDIDYALIPVTAYSPRWFMHYAHLDPREALDAFQELKARYMIPTQWGTFRLGDDPVGLPALDLRKALKDTPVDPDRLIVMDLGQILPITPRPTL
jgi:N-acyl-phosphatidylethanolamine-hydrolysing phospholipase D